MKKIFLIMVVSLAASGLKQAIAQVPDDLDGRLYRLCKTWGYFKYFSQHRCELKWDTLLNTTINEVLIANSNADFNGTLMTMFNKVGNNAYVTPNPQPDTNLNVDNSWIDDPVFSQEVRNFLDTFSLYTGPDTSTCFVKYNTDPWYVYNSYIDFRKDPLSMPIDLTMEAHRLTTMFYYWNVISYFSPYRNIMDHPWDSTLIQFIPQIRQATTVFNFHKTFLKLVTRINDSHDFTKSLYLTYYFWGGNYFPKIYFIRAENQCVVKKVDIIDIAPGDILTAINGIPIQEIEDSLALYIPASTPAALYRDLYCKMIQGGSNTTLNLTLLDCDNTGYTVTVTRSYSLDYWWSWKMDNGLNNPYSFTACDYGYVILGLLLEEDVQEMYDALKNAPVIIFDIRTYPNVWVNVLAPLFFPAPITSAIIYDPAVSGHSEPLNYYCYLPGWYYKPDDPEDLDTIWSNPEPYSGKVYLLVNEETQSAGESMCQYFSYLTNAKVIGTQTAGTDGNTSTLELPSGISTSFSSLGWYYADGYQQQRNGLKIDTIVSITIEGIRQGRDEILEAALDCLYYTNEIVSTGKKISIYPNPFSSGSLHIALTLDKNSEITLSLLDLAGNLIRQESYQCFQGKNDLMFNISHVAAGIYVLKVQHGDEFTNVKVLVK